MPKRLTTAEFIARARRAHGGHYDYSLTIYKNNISKIIIICPKHGQFKQRASHHMGGHGCPKCKSEHLSTIKKYSHESFIARARAIHGDTYDYSRTKYIASGRKIEIGCPMHGPFSVTPNNHLSRKSGCPKCAGKGMTTSEFIVKSIDVHKGKFTCDRTRYTKIKDHVTITCEKHGDFTQTAESHLIGRGCKQCWYESSSSHGENELASWVASIGVPVIRNDRKRIGLEIDILSGNIGIEYNGCYWHSHRVIRSDQHKLKRVAAESAGIRIIFVWDFDWIHKRNIVERMIMSALGSTDNSRISARRCTITEITGNQANMFYARNHIQGPCRGAVVNIALVHEDDIVASMSFTRGGARRGRSEDWELARYATSAIVRGGASKLFSAFRKRYNPVAVWSYSDTQHFSGALYPTIGFEIDEELPPDYRIIHPYKMKVWHKSSWQRSKIPARLNELGIDDHFCPEKDPRTEFQMHDVARVLRIYDAGKIRWVWRI